MLCFAYGSNMDAESFRARCPGARWLGRARLAEHAYRIAARGYATAVAHEGASVHGVLWELDARDLAALDAYEGLDEGLFRREERVVLDEHGAGRAALVYFACDAQPGRPLPGYQEAVVAAARAHGLPPEHVRALEAWLEPVA